MGNFPDYNLDWKEMLPTSYILTLYHGHYMKWDAHRDWEEESNMVRQSAVVVQGVVFSALRDDIWYLEMQTTLVRHLAAGWERRRSSGPITWGRTRYTWLLATELLTTDQLSRCSALHWEYSILHWEYNTSHWEYSTLNWEYSTLHCNNFPKYINSWRLIWRHILVLVMLMW